MRHVTTPGSWQTDGRRTVKVEVLVVAEHMGKTEAAAMYREIL